MQIKIVFFILFKKFINDKNNIVFQLILYKRVKYLIKTIKKAKKNTKKCPFLYNFMQFQQFRLY